MIKLAIEAVKENNGIDADMTEMDFSLDAFNKQKTLKGIYAWAQLLNRLLRKRKGTNPSDPNMGIGLDRYRFADIDQLTSGGLADTIRSQCSIYLPNIPIQNIDISSVYVKGAYVLYINIVLIGEREITLAYTQKNKSIISTKIVVNDQELINTKGSD